MSASAYLQIDLIPLLALLIVAEDRRVHKRAERGGGIFSTALLFVLLGLLCDAATWLLDGRSGAPARVLLYALNTLFFLLIVLAPVLWLQAVMVRLRGAPLPDKGIIAALLPIALYALLLLANLFHPLLFYINAQNLYVRGPLVFLQQALSLGYLLAGSVMALYYVRSADVEKRREARLLSLFIALPFLAGVIQSLFYGVSLVWPAAAAALVMVHINTQQTYMLRDPMTRLNNRRCLDAFLLSRCEADNARRGPLYVIMLDINAFKRINDLYGHPEGDRAIGHVAAALRECFGRTNAFISRFGGDEFCVALNTEDAALVSERLAALQAALAQSAPEAAYKLSLSIGCTVYDYGEPCTPAELLARADAQMYRAKERFKEGGSGDLGV